MDFENSQYYTNRELSWIQFNYRVLEEARDKSNPLFARLKFLSIPSSNLDEFFMVRVASLKDMVNAGYKKPDIAGMTPKEQLSAISEALHEFTQTQYSTYNRSLLPLLAKEHITVLTSFEQMNDEEASFADNFFMEKVYPVLTPMAVDASRPFPLIRNKSLNIAALIKTKNQSEEEMEPELEFATVQVPSVMGRIVQLPCTEGVKLILLEEIIRRNIESCHRQVKFGIVEIIGFTACKKNNNCGCAYHGNRHYNKVGRRKAEYAVGCTFCRTVTSVFHRSCGICTMLKGIRYSNGENMNTASDTASKVALVYIVSNKTLSRRRLLCPSCKHRHCTKRH